MAAYQVLDQVRLIDLAAQRGWIEGVADPGRKQHRIPPVDFSSGDRMGTLPEATLETGDSLTLRIPDAVLHGGNFSLIVEDRIFPGGFVHSFWPSPQWTPVEQGRIHYQLKPPREIALEASLLGIVSHWGHFFVDALDRLLRLEALGRLRGPLLISDPDFFGLQPALDACQAVPQVSDLMRLLGVALDPGDVIPVLKQFDYRVSGLTLCTLESIKPAISPRSILALRERVLSGVGEAHGAGETVLFVGRSDIKKRFILDQPAVVRYLSTVHRVKTVFPEHLTSAEGVREFRAAAGVILPVGSAKFNLAFCRPGTKVVCVTPRGYAAMNTGVVLMTRHLCHVLGLKLAFYDVEIERCEPLINSNMIISETDADRIVDTFEDL